jgi:hypothetical protein
VKVIAWSRAALIPVPADPVRFQTVEVGSAYFSMRAVVYWQTRVREREEKRKLDVRS